MLNNIEFDLPNLFKKELKVVKRNASKFYKLVAKEILWMVLGFDKNRLLINENINSMQVVCRIIKKYLKKNFENDLEVFLGDPEFREVLGMNESPNNS